MRYPYMLWRVDQGAFNAFGVRGHVRAFRAVPQSRDRRSPNNSTRHSPDYGVIIVPSFSTSVALFLRSLITNVLFSPRVDHGPRGTSLKSTNFQSVTSVLCRPR